MKRSAPLRRTPMRKRSGTSYSRRPRDLAYMGWIKQQPCAARHFGACSGVIEADHAGRHGTGQKSPDNECIPLCKRHHADRTGKVGGRGVFDAMSAAELRQWLDERILFFQALYAAPPAIPF